MSLQQHLLSLGLPAIALCGAPAVSLSAQQPSRASRRSPPRWRAAHVPRSVAQTRRRPAARCMPHGSIPTPRAGELLQGRPPLSRHAIYRSTCPGSARRGSALPPRRVTPPDTTLRSSAPRSGSTLIRPTRERSPPSPARVCPSQRARRDSLRKMAQLRREVGDVSELDVRLAAVNAGQLENVAADDSIAACRPIYRCSSRWDCPRKR